MKTMKYLAVFLLLFLVRINSLVCAEVSPQEFKHVTNALSQALKLCQASSVSEKTADATWAGRDPLRPLIDSEGNPVKGTGFSDGPALQGIVRSQGFTRALIDDQLYSEGDAVGPFKLQKIREDGIELEQGGSVSFIPLYPQAEAGKKEELP